MCHRWGAHILPWSSEEQEVWGVFMEGGLAQWVKYGEEQTESTPREMLIWTTGWGWVFKELWLIQHPSVNHPSIRPHIYLTSSTLWKGFEVSSNWVRLEWMGQKGTVGYITGDLEAQEFGLYLISSGELLSTNYSFWRLSQWKGVSGAMLEVGRVLMRVNKIVIVEMEKKKKPWI